MMAASSHEQPRSIGEQDKARAEELKAEANRFFGGKIVILLIRDSIRERVSNKGFYKREGF
jgi:hypothetical protein